MPLSSPGVFRIEVLSPPGDVVAPNGFPANPRPKAAPQVFLDAINIRIRVFCDEQKCAIEPELDEDDPRSWSWVAYQSIKENEDQQVPVSTLRIVPPPHPPHPNDHGDVNDEPFIKLTRVATVAEARGQGLFPKLLDEAFGYLSANPALINQGWKGLVLTHAQVQVESLYAKLGFITDPNMGRWYEEGIEHLGMWRRLDLKSRKQ